mmetsp:Transcript_15654/g.36042  ORF Transcript_15654/g.36042 Transcript_15654/m.36042 type:complete len:91 (+) Transcript_15654:27-299(+)
MQHLFKIYSECGTPELHDSILPQKEISAAALSALRPLAALLDLSGTLAPKSSESPESQEGGFSNPQFVPKNLAQHSDQPSFEHNAHHTCT